MPTREYQRVRIRLPARLRWTTPFGLKIELSETMDVSRSGLLLCSREFHAAGVPLWVTFPYDVSLPDGQPEVPARVVRCGKLHEESRSFEARQEVPAQTPFAQKHSAESRQSTSDSSITEPVAPFALAIHLKGPAHEACNGNGKRRDPERRSSPRCPLAIPIRVRPEHVPWFEEAMSLDFSPRGMRFRSQREYAIGEPLRIFLEDVASTPWAGSGESRAKVVRVSQSPDGTALDVGVCQAP